MRILLKSLELSAIVLFEIEEPITQNAESRKDFARSRLNRSQVLTHNDHLLPNALQRENAQEVLGAIAHVRAGGRIHTLRNPVQAKESHYVIDAQRTAVTAVLANGFNEELISGLPMLLRVGRWKSPVLPLGGKVIRGRAHAATGYTEFPMGPKIGAGAVRGQREIVIKTDR